MPVLTSQAASGGSRTGSALHLLGPRLLRQELAACGCLLALSWLSGMRHCLVCRFRTQ